MFVLDEISGLFCIILISQPDIPKTPFRSALGAYMYVHMLETVRPRIKYNFFVYQNRNISFLFLYPLFTAGYNLDLRPRPKMLTDEI